MLRFPFKRVGFRQLLGTCVLAAVAYTGVGDALESRIGLPGLFRARHLAGIEPQLDPRIKIFILDDRTAQDLGRADPTLADWQALLAAIGNRGAKAVLVEGGFEFGSGNAFVRPTSTRQTKIIAPATFSSQEIPWRTLIDAKSKESEGRPKLLRRGWLYGPPLDLAPFFDGAGHLYQEDGGLFEPILHAANSAVTGQAAMHIGFASAFDSIVAVEDFVRTHPQLIDRRGRMVVNQIPSDVIAKREVSLLEQIRRARDGMEISNVERGDTVLIIWGFSAGHGGTTASLVDTPLGKMRLGEVLAAIANEVISESYVRIWDYRELAVFLGGVASLVFLGIPLSWEATLIGAALVAGGVFWTACVAFVMDGAVLPWVWFCCGFAVGVSAMVMQNFLSVFMRTMAIQGALHGHIAPNTLLEIVRRPKRLMKLRQEAAYQTVSLLVFEIVSLPLLDGDQPKDEAFSDLKTVLHEVFAVVMRFGGFVERTYGDGALCTFGHFEPFASAQTHHSHKALACACAIQHVLLDINEKQVAAGKPQYPVRIGLHTTDAYFGDIGDSVCIDFTSVTNGTRLARYMQAACDPYVIVASPEALHFTGVLPQEGTEANVTVHPPVQNATTHEVGVMPRLVQIGIGGDLRASFMCDPVHKPEDKLRRQKLQTLYNESRGRFRGAERFFVNDLRPIFAVSPQGIFRVVNFSRSGLAFESMKSFAKGVVLNMRFACMSQKIDPERGGLTALPERTDLMVLMDEPILVEVMWSHSKARKNHHGGKFAGMTKEAELEVFKVLQSV